MTKTFCDRCNSDKNVKPYVMPKLFQKNSKDICSYKGEECELMDLCQDCVNELRNWIIEFKERE